MVIVVDPIGKINMQNKKEFAIVTEKGQDYVLIYNNDNCYYLIEAEIDNEKIIIDTTKQSVVTKDQIVYKKVKFEVVIRDTLEE